MDEPKHFWMIVDIYTNVLEALIDTLHFDENFFWNDGGGPVTVKEENLPSLQQSCSSNALPLRYHRRHKRASIGDH